MSAASVIPSLPYPDVVAAAEWLSRAFGFRVRWRAGGHRAQLAVGDGAVVLVEGADAPAGATGPAILVRVDDVEAHHARSRGAGATILTEPADFPYGERQYGALDLAGHRWTFSQSIADVPPESWGATTG
jgi:uncharacterized glyoxalase superfamily protein PhnB